MIGDKFLSEPARKRMNARRLMWPDSDDIELMTISKFPDENARKTLLEFIDRHTTSKFYLGGNKIGFADERDALIFRLKFHIR